MGEGGGRFHSPCIVPAHTHSGLGHVLALANEMIPNETIRGLRNVCALGLAFSWGSLDPEATTRGKPDYCVGV